METRLARIAMVVAFGFMVLGSADARSAQMSQADPQPPQAAVSVPTIAPRAEDVSSIDGIMSAFYEVISGPAGQPRQWSRDRTLYIPGVWFVSMREDAQHNPVGRVMSHQQFVDQSNSGLVQKGFFEAEIHRETERFGNIAHIFSTYDSRITQTGPVIARGVNSIELYWDGKRWWIVAAIWDDERSDNPIPKKLLP